MSPNQPRRKRWRLIVLPALAVAFIVGVALLGPPRIVDDTLALRRFLAASGLTVRQGASPPAPPGAFVLLQDLRSREQAAALLRWAESGGRLVVTDPTSPILSLTSTRVVDQVGLIGTQSLRPGCVAPDVVGVSEILVDTGDSTLRSSDPTGIACFTRPGGSYAVITPIGQGDVVVVGGPSLVTNELLNKGDNAVFALRLLGGRGPVVFGPPADPGAQPHPLWSLVSDPARLVLIEIAVAALLFAVARGRRLGRAPSEDPIVPIPASELVQATAGLYRRARVAAFCGRMLRTSAAGRLARRLGAPPDLPAARLSELVAEASSLPRDQVERALAGPDPTNDAELMTLGDALAKITRDTEGAIK